MTISIYDICIYGAAILPIVSTIAYLLTKANPILYVYSLFLSTSGPIIFALKLAMTPQSLLAPYFTTIATIFIIYAVIAIVLGVISVSLHLKSKKKAKKQLLSCSN